MPAPLAKGLIFSISVLIAAGIAVYENPQVRQWVDSSRRKIAIALHNLGDEIGPNSPTRQFPPDPSTRPDESPEAAERRRRARNEILERGRILQEKRGRQKNPKSEKSESFNSLVDKDGNLMSEQGGASTTAADIKPQMEDQALRKRNTETDAAALGSALANPFADELHAEFSHRTENDTPPPSTTRSSTPTLPNSPVKERSDHNTLIPLELEAEVISNHSSEALIDLTPTTTHSSAAHAGFPELSFPSSSHRNPWSVHEWAENTSSAFYSASSGEQPNQVTNGSDVESLNGVEAESDAESLIRVGTNSDVRSEDSFGTGTRTPGSWSEIGSVLSEEF